MQTRIIVHLNPQASDVREIVCQFHGTSQRFNIRQSNPLSCVIQEITATSPIKINYIINDSTLNQIMFHFIPQTPYKKLNPTIKFLSADQTLLNRNPIQEPPIKNSIFFTNSKQSSPNSTTANIQLKLQNTVPIYQQLTNNNK